MGANTSNGAVFFSLNASVFITRSVDVSYVSTGTTQNHLCAGKTLLCGLIYCNVNDLGGDVYFIWIIEIDKKP